MTFHHEFCAQVYVLEYQAWLLLLPWLLFFCCSNEETNKYSALQNQPIKKHLSIIIFPECH